MNRNALALLSLRKVPAFRVLQKYEGAEHNLPQDPAEVSLKPPARTRISHSCSPGLLWCQEEGSMVTVTWTCPRGQGVRESGAGTS